MSEYGENLIEEFERVRQYIHKAKDGGMRDGVSKYETIYGLAYRKLVNAGLKPKLRMKYRPLY